MESTRSKGGSVIQKPSKAQKQADPPVMVLRLRPPEEVEQAQQPVPQESNTTRRVQWAEDTIDNEHMDKFKSNSSFIVTKVCCIYHAPREAVESGIKSESPETESSDDHNAYERSRETKKKRRQAKMKKGGCCNHDHNHQTTAEPHPHPHPGRSAEPPGQPNA